MQGEELKKLTAELKKAHEGGGAIEPLSARYPDMTLQVAYEVQLMLLETWRKAGRRVVGRKVALTSQATQEGLGTHEPAFGHLFADMVWHSGDLLRFKDLYQPRIEGELAVVLGERLAGPGLTLVDVLRAGAGLMPALEIPDTRIRDWNITVTDLVADNCAARAIVVGSGLVPMNAFDPRYVGYVLERNRRLLATGVGADVMGNPLLAVVWLANKMGELGLALEPGEIILTGSTVAPTAVERGDRIALTIDRVGRVACGFE